MVNLQMISQIKQFMQNPNEFIQRNIPQEYQNNPQGMIQHLMDTGKLNQAQYTQLQQTAKQIQSMLK